MNKKDNEIYRAIVKMCIRLARQITDDKEALAVKVLFKNLNKQIITKKLRFVFWCQSGAILVYICYICRMSMKI